MEGGYPRVDRCPQLAFRQSRHVNVANAGFSVGFEQIAESNAQGAGEPRQHEDGHVELASFEAGHVRPIHPDVMRECLLR